MTYRATSNTEQYLTKTGNWSDRIHPARGLVNGPAEPLPRVDDDCDLEQLEEAKIAVERTYLALQDEMTRIKDQIARAKAEVERDGKYSDSDWWARVNSALRHKGRQHQQTQLLIGEINRRIRKKRAELDQWDDGRKFITAAKQILPDVTYREIWAMVHRAERM